MSDCMNRNCKKPKDQKYAYARSDDLLCLNLCEYCHHALHLDPAYIVAADAYDEANAALHAAIYGGHPEIAKHHSRATSETTRELRRVAWAWCHTSTVHAAIDAGIAELDAGLGVECTPNKLMDEVYKEIGVDN